MADYGLLGALGTGLNAGLDSYRLERDYNQKQEQMGLEKALQKKQRAQELLMKGYVENPDGSISKTPEKLKEERISRLEKRAGLLGQGYDIKEEPSGDVALSKVPGWKSPEQRAMDQAMFTSGLAQKKELAKETREAQVPGFQLSQEMVPSSKDAETLKKQSASVQKINDLVSAMQSKIKKADKVNPILDQKYRADLNNDYAALKIAWKNAAELGALSGPDVGLIEQANIDPTSYKADILGVEGVLANMEEAKNRANMGLMGEAKARGYLASGESAKKAGLNFDPSKAGMDKKTSAVASPKPIKVIQNGHEYTLNPKTGKYE